MTTETPIKIQIVKTLSTASPSRIVAVKADGDTAFSLWVTDKTGIPYPLKDNTGGGGGGTIEAIINTDGNLTITGTTTKTINVSSSLLLLINSALQAGDNISELINDANYITLADIPAFVAADYDLEDFTNVGTDPYAHISDLSAGATNLSYTASPTQGVVISDTGSDATIPLADGTNAGLLEPSKYTILENTSGTNTGDQDLQSVLNSGNYAEEDSGESWVEILGGSPHLRHFNAGLYSGAGIDNSTEFFVNPYSINLYNSGTTKEGGLNVDSGELYLYSKNKILNKDTSLYFNTPTESTIINIPAPTIAGTYTLATLDDIPTPIDITGLVPYTGATTDVDLGEHQLKTGQLELDQTPTGTFSTAKIRWNDTAGTAEMRLKGNSVTLQLGQELVKRVVNKTTTNITLQESNYQVVRIIGATGQRLSVDLAQADSEANSASTLGLVTENIANNQEGFITFSGEINLINTTGSLQGETWVDGDVLYLSPTIAGQLTNIEPIAPDRKIRVGYVQYAHATQGKIHVDVDRGYSLENLHNVKITATTAGKILGSTTEGLWENKTIPDALGFTPENVANKQNSLAIDGTGTKYPTVDAVFDALDLKLNISDLPTNLTGYELKSNKQNSLAVDGTNTKYPTVTAVNAGLALKSNDNAVVHLTGAETITGQKTFSPTISASGAIARGTYLTPSLTATANNDVLVGLDINTTFTNGAFTGTKSLPVRVTSNQYIGMNVSRNSTGGSAITISNNNGGYNFGVGSINEFFIQRAGGNIVNTIFSTGNSIIQNGGTFTDDLTNRLQVTGTVSSGTTALGNTPPTANNQLTRKDYVDTGLALKANLASPALTGTPTAPTAAPGTNTTQIATMAALQTALDLKADLGNAFTAGRVPYTSSASAISDSSKLLWNNTNSYFEVNGIAPRITLKNNLNNFSTYFTNNAGGGLALKNHQDKTLAFFTNPVGSTDQPQMAIGNVTSIPTESQLYVYGGINGANIDARGSATVDECNIDLEGNDWTTSPNSLGFSYFGSKATSSGTMLGYPKNKLGIIRFQETNYAIINSEKVAGVSPIRFGINNIEIGNVNDKGFSYQSDFSSENISNPRWLADKGYVDTKAPLSGSTNYIQNQNASAQSANMWISGSIKAGAATFASTVTATGGNFSGSTHFGTGISTTTLNGKEIQFYNAGASPAILKVTDNATSINAIELSKSGAVANVVVPNGTVTASNGTLIGGTLTSGYIPKATGANSLGNSLIYENSGSVIISSAKNSIGGTVQLDGSWTNGTVFGGDGGDKFLLGNSIFLGGGATLCGANSTLNDFAPVGIIGSYIKFGINADEKMRLNLTGNFLLNTTADDGVNKLQVNGSISATSYTGSATLTGTPTAPTAAPGATGNQIATLDYVQATRPYKVYTALLSQSGTNAPTAIVLENTIGAIVWSRTVIGGYFATLSGAFTTDKTSVLITNGSANSTYIHGAQVSTSNVNVITVADGQIDKATIEIRVYN